MGSFKQKLFATSPWAADVALLIVRVAFGAGIALSHGLGKVRDLGKFTGIIAGRGFPLPEVLGPAAALSEFVGGLLIAAGLFTRPAAGFVLATMAVAAFKVHAADPFAKKELAFAYGAVALALLVSGAGRFSADARWLARRAGRRGA